MCFHASWTSASCVLLALVAEVHGLSSDTGLVERIVFVVFWLPCWDSLESVEVVNGLLGRLLESLLWWVLRVVLPIV